MFEALAVAEGLVKTMRPVADAIERRSAPLADQLRRATESVFLNLGEARWRTGRDRINRYRYAAGSAQEALAAVRAAVGWGYLRDEHAREVSALLDRILAMAYRLIHNRSVRPT